MKSTYNLFSVVMDGIKDTKMLMDYSQQAEKEGKPNRAQWFKIRARRRLDQLGTDWREVDQETQLSDKINDGDEIAEAMRCMVKLRIEELQKWYDEL